MSAVLQGATVAHTKVCGIVQTGWFTHGFLPAPNKKLSSNLLKAIARSSQGLGNRLDFRISGVPIIVDHLTLWYRGNDVSSKEFNT